jgi:hypothetical protein
MKNSEADLILDLKAENQKLKESLAMSDAILSVLKARGFESEIVYIKYEIENNLSRYI